jgi:hypothetical protein
MKTADSGFQFSLEDILGFCRVMKSQSGFLCVVEKLTEPGNKVSQEKKK